MDEKEFSWWAAQQCPCLCEARWELIRCTRPRQKPQHRSWKMSAMFSVSSDWWVAELIRRQKQVVSEWTGSLSEVRWTWDEETLTNPQSSAPMPWNTTVLLNVTKDSFFCLFFFDLFSSCCIDLVWEYTVTTGSRNTKRPQRWGHRHNEEISLHSEWLWRS